MAPEQIERMGIEELEEFLDLPGNDRICRERGCYNVTASGYVVCLQCLHGTSPRADYDLVAAKKRLAKLKRKARAAAAWESPTREGE
jgi:hypothetical protein